MLGAQPAEASCIPRWTTIHLNIVQIHVHLPSPPPSTTLQDGLSHHWIQIPTAYVICTTSITPAPATSVSSTHSGFLTLQPRLCLSKLLPRKYPSLTFALCKYWCMLRLIAWMFAEREQGQIEMRFQILMNIWGKHSLPQPQLFTQPHCAVKQLLIPTCLFRGNRELQHPSGNSIQVWGSCMKPFPCQGMMSSYPQLKEVKKIILKLAGSQTEWCSTHHRRYKSSTQRASALLRASLPSALCHGTPAAPGTSASKTLLTWLALSYLLPKVLFSPFHQIWVFL